jgi:tRNA-dihydrouridine synthase
MSEPELVADCVRAMGEKLSIPVTVKHRTGIDQVGDQLRCRGKPDLVGQRRPLAFD